MCPIVSNLGSPTYNLSKWLINEFNHLEVQQSSFSVNNSYEFVNKVKDLELKDNEILISFDVNSLFPSIPIDETLTFIRDLLQANRLPENRIDQYIRLTKLYIDQNQFLYNGKYYKQT